MKETLACLKLICDISRLKKLWIASCRFKGVTTHKDEDWTKSVQNLSIFMSVTLFISTASIITFISVFEEGRSMSGDFLWIICLTGLTLWWIKNLVYTISVFGNAQLQLEEIGSS